MLKNDEPNIVIPSSWNFFIQQLKYSWRDASKNNKEKWKEGKIMESINFRLKWFSCEHIPSIFSWSIINVVIINLLKRSGFFHSYWYMYVIMSENIEKDRKYGKPKQSQPKGMWSKRMYRLKLNSETWHNDRSYHNNS